MHKHNFLFITFLTIAAPLTANFFDYPAQQGYQKTESSCEQMLGHKEVEIEQLKEQNRNQTQQLQMLLAEKEKHEQWSNWLLKESKPFSIGCGTGAIIATCGLYYYLK